MSRLSDFSNNQALKNSYREWLELPLTQEVLAIIQENFLRPLLPTSVGMSCDKHSASFCLGENAGAWKIFDAIQSLDNIQIPKAEQPAETYTKPKEA